MEILLFMKIIYNFRSSTIYVTSQFLLQNAIAILSDVPRRRIIRSIEFVRIDRTIDLTIFSDLQAFGWEG